MSIFLSDDDIALLTGRKTKSKQIEVLRKMGLPIWINAVGKPVATVEGSKEATMPKMWNLPSIRYFCGCDYCE